MRLLLLTAGIVLVLAGTALGQSVDLRAPDQQAPPSQQAAPGVDLRAPDQQSPSPAVASAAVDFRAPDQRAPAPAGGHVAAAPTPDLPTPVTDGGPATIVFVLIGVAAGLAVLIGGFVMLRLRHRTAIADDLIAH